MGIYVPVYFSVRMTLPPYGQTHVSARKHKVNVIRRTHGSAPMVKASIN